MVDKKVKIFSVAIDALTTNQALERIKNFVDSKFPHQIVTVNPEFLMESLTNKEFKQALIEAELTVADGIGIRAVATYQLYSLPAWLPARIVVAILLGFWMGLLVLFNRRALKKPIPETITGVDLIEAIARSANDNNWKLYFLGGKGDTAIIAANKLKSRYHNLAIVGAEEGIIWDPKQPLNKDVERLIKHVNQAKPDILLVAFGAPKQDLFIYRYKKDLRVPVMIGVGGAFDFIAGRISRAPKFMRTIGLEWLWRLIVEPWRYKRIITATLKFPWKIFLTTIRLS